MRVPQQAAERKKSLSIISCCGICEKKKAYSESGYNIQGNSSREAGRGQRAKSQLPALFERERRCGPANPGAWMHLIKGKGGKAGRSKKGGGGVKKKQYWWRRRTLLDTTQAGE